MGWNEGGGVAVGVVYYKWRVRDAYRRSGLGRKGFQRVRFVLLWCCDVGSLLVSVVPGHRYPDFGGIYGPSIKSRGGYAAGKDTFS